MDDLCAIENLLSIIQQDLCKYEFNSLHDVREKLMDIWKNFSEEKCVKMIDSIPKRLETIIRKQGQRITKRVVDIFTKKHFLFIFFSKMYDENIY